MTSDDSPHPIGDEGVKQPLETKIPFQLYTSRSPSLKTKKLRDKVLKNKHYFLLPWFLFKSPSSSITPSL